MVTSQPCPSPSATDKGNPFRPLPIRVWSEALGKYSELPHVLLIVDQFPKTFGGGERIAMKIAGLLPGYGFRASILTFSIHPDCEEVSTAPCPVYLLPLDRTYDLRALRASFALRRFVRQQNVCLAQTFFESSDLWAGGIIKLMTDAKLIWSRRDMGILRGRKHEIAYRLMAKMPDRVFAVSEQVRRHCLDVDGVPPERVETVYNGLDLELWPMSDDRVRRDGPRKVVTVGNIRRVKGHDLMIRAAALIVKRFPDVTFSIAGAVLEPEYFNELNALIRDLGLSDTFRFEGPVSNLQEHLSSADIFVLPSRSEGFSNAIVEAMAAGLPVVATDVGGNREAVEDGVSGTIVRPEDVNSLANSIAALLADRPKASAMGKAGTVRVAEKFSTRTMMLRITDTYRRLLPDRRNAVQV